MSGIAGWFGTDNETTIHAMLNAIDYRGDQSDTLVTPRFGMGVRFFGGRAAKSRGVWRRDNRAVVCAGTFTNETSDPSAHVDTLIREPQRLRAVDGAFAFAHATDRTLTLGRDPFGVRSLYIVKHRNNLYFASELKQLLAIDDLPVVLDEAAIHKYLTFSFVPGEDVPIMGIKRLLAGHTLTYGDATLGDSKATRYFQLKECIDSALGDPKVAARRVREHGEHAIKSRLYGEERVGLFLSGGLDSAAVGVWLKKAGANVHSFSLDFGEKGVEREEADLVAKTLGFAQSLVSARGEDIVRIFDDVVHRLDLPFGDPVTGPQYLLGEAARAHGVTCVFNGEGGDQLFGGWTSKPMIAAELYGGLFEETDESREEAYLRSYHRFYGLEDALYTSEFRARVGTPGQRRALLRPYLGDSQDYFLNRVRLADIALKGSQNILPRAERMGNGWGLDVRTPLFDRALAELSFSLPPEMKLRGACEKWILKRIMQSKLPESLVWRRKFGMSVPVTDFVEGPLAALVRDHLSPEVLKRRGLFRPEYVAQLLDGKDSPGETRRRRVGEKVWTLLMLEAWLRRFVDTRGVRTR